MTEQELNELKRKAKEYDTILSVLSIGIYKYNKEQKTWDYYPGDKLKLFYSLEYEQFVAHLFWYGSLSFADIGKLWVPYSEEFEVYADYIDECYRNGETPKYDTFEKWEGRKDV